MFGRDIHVKEGRLTPSRAHGFESLIALGEIDIEQGDGRASRSEEARADQTDTRRGACNDHYLSSVALSHTIPNPPLRTKNRTTNPCYRSLVWYHSFGQYAHKGFKASAEEMTELFHWALASADVP